jgi:hypothetical protein
VRDLKKRLKDDAWAEIGKVRQKLGKAIALAGMFDGALDTHGLRV